MSDSTNAHAGLPPQQQRGGLNRTALIVVGLVAVLVVTGIGGFFGFKAAMKDSVDQMFGAPPTSSVPDESQQGDVYNSRTSLLEYVNEKYDVDALLNKAARDAVEDGYVDTRPSMTSITTAERPKDKDEYREADILSEYAFGLFAASTQGNSPQEIEDARRLMSIFLDKDHPNYESTVAKIGNGLGPIFENMLLISSWPPVFEGSYRGHTFNGSQAQFIEMKIPSSGAESMLLFQLIKTTDGKYENWILVDSFVLNDQVRSDVASLLPGNN